MVCMMHILFLLSCHIVDVLCSLHYRNLTYFGEWCHKRFPAAAPTPRPYWVPTYYGGKNLEGYSNILFANGDLDPW
jgi:hypothetical protein